MPNFTAMDMHEKYMWRCLQLAKMGAGNVAPNPMVGAVLVHNGLIIGEGFHEQYGHAHAEVNCINNVAAENRQLIASSTLYVSLEPCNHTGKTPPCTDLIIDHKIAKVVVACKDSFAKVNGSGIKKLQDAGIDVTVGVLEKNAIDLNKRFFTFQKKQRPYIILKWAQSADKKIASTDYAAVKISNEITDRLSHKWRGEESAIIVGTNTALHDNPALTTRLWPGKNPVRIFIDKDLKVPETHHLLDKTVATIIINCVKQEEDGVNTFYKIGKDENVVAVLVNIMRQRNILSAIIEGGTKLLQSFITEDCWDEARVITNKKLILKEGINAPLLNARAIESFDILNDEVCIFHP